jgi:2-C-methyl-D-erythritol 2,4-cyclodiphosphate synthase
MTRIKTGLGQDSHRFDFKNNTKPLILGGILFTDHPPLQGNSDADVVLHALTNAISGVTGVNILGAVSDELCFKQGITDSRVYVQEALKYLKGFQICHVSCSIEAKTPKISPQIAEMKASLSQLLNLPVEDIGITATSGEGLTAFGRGEGIQVFCMVTVASPDTC